MNYFFYTTIFAVLANIAIAKTLPVLLSPVNTSETGSCKSLPSTPKLAEIKESLRSQVNPYLTTRYGPLRNCGGPGWIKVVSVNMSDSNSSCPAGFRLRNSPVRSCGRQGNAKTTTATFSVGESYSHVCGRMTAIQKGSTDGFGPFYFDTDVSHYMDGITIRYASAFNKGHIWTFVAGAGEAISSIQRYCPCGFDQWNFALPSFIGSDYFCETGNRGDVDFNSVFLDDPLWNGKGCVRGKECCKFNDPPWFYRELPQPTTNHLRVTMYINSEASDENIFITEMELYVSP